ncbi:MAG: class I SAM-dependent methyltransferase, partial [Gemmatimonadaceae bacterium]
MTETKFVFDDAAAYERYMGRWSRPIAALFVRWLGVPDGGAWLDVGCGTGALSQTILATANPRLVIGCERSAGYVDTARRSTDDPRAQFIVAMPNEAPSTEGGFDAAVSGLVLNFLADPVDALGVMRRRTRPGGVVGSYVWDYSRGMEMLRIFWDEAVALDPAAGARDERRMPLCRQGELTALWRAHNLRDVSEEALAIQTVFSSFDDYWSPFLGQQGPAGAYVATLAANDRERLRRGLRRRLQGDNGDGPIVMSARAWAVRGRTPWSRQPNAGKRQSLRAERLHGVDPRGAACRQVAR